MYRPYESSVYRLSLTYKLNDSLEPDRSPVRPELLPVQGVPGARAQLVQESLQGMNEAVVVPGTCERKS